MIIQRPVHCIVPVLREERLSANPELVGGTAMDLLDAVVESLTKAEVMTILNKEIFAVKKVIEDMVDDLPSKEELRTMKENAADLENRLAETDNDESNNEQAEEEAGEESDFSQ